jgi:hypothetical protein
VQQEEMQLNAWTFQCCRIHRTAQLCLPSDFHLFPKLKEHLKGQRFSYDESVNSAFMKSFQKQNTIFRDGFQKLVLRWRKCIEVRGDFVEK